MKFNTIDEAIEDIKNGKIIVVVDDEDHLKTKAICSLAPSTKVTPEAVNFMAYSWSGS